MQISRLLEIVYILLDKKTVTAKELAEHFEVSQRTIYRDIDALGEAGIPVYTNQGKGGGICLLDTFVLNKSILSDKEQTEILSSLQGLKALNVPEVGTVLKKLSTLFGKSVTDWIDVDFSHWGSDETERDKFDRIKKAILSSVVITFDYTNTLNETRKRTVEPIQIIIKDKSWYLRAYCNDRQDFRTFKIIRMKNLALTRQTFTRKEPPAQIDKAMQENAIAIKLKISKDISNRVFDEFFLDAVTQDEEGNYLVTVKFPEGEWVYGFIMSFGAWCEVLDPPHIRETVRRRFEDSLRNYS
jgi:predicted DNA-binding transcriptional regulator YafY